MLKELPPDKNILLQRLLDRGFYPRELPPTFKTKNFGSTIVGNRQVLKPNASYAGQTTFLDGSTFQGNHRMFGIINPINYSLLSDFISENWTDIDAASSKSTFSNFSVKFPNSINTGGRSFIQTAFSQKAREQAILSSSYPCVVTLDINRFYGSIYSHSIPWAILGKKSALDLHAKKTLDAHWSAALDKLVRACNRNQTIGIPIGPDTSRIISEIILSRIDLELANDKPRIKAKQALHSIDDYEFGAMGLIDAESIAARFERVIRSFELRSREDKKSITYGSSPKNLNWKLRFNLIEDLSDENIIDGIFSVIMSERELSPGSNVVGYGLGRFSTEIAQTKDKSKAIEHLQRLVYCMPGYIHWAAPFLVGLKNGGKLNTGQKRLLRWGVDECARRHDTVSLLWFLYLHIEFDLKISKKRVKTCFDVDSPLVDLTIAHAHHNDLTPINLNIFSKRYKKRSLNGDAWLFLYENEVRSWKITADLIRIGTAEDPNKFYKYIARQNVRFYDTEAFGVESFDWRLKAQDFNGGDIPDAFKDFHSPHADTNSSDSNHDGKNNHYSDSEDYYSTY